MSEASQPESQTPSRQRSDAARVQIYRATTDDAGQRLDNLLLRLLKGVPRSRVYRLLRTGQVRVSGRRARPLYRVQAGDEIRLPPIRRTSGDVATVSIHRAAALTTHIVYEDDALLVVDKPSGWLVHGGADGRPGVIEALRAVRPQAGLELVHRLDRETSGCLLLAKGRAALRPLHDQWRQGAVEKRYLVLLQGGWGEAPQRVDAPIRRKAGSFGARARVAVDTQGKHSVTEFRPLERLPGCTLAEAELHTGRMHQIRIHAAHMGHPVAGDDRYGSRAFNRRLKGTGLQRLFLHAHALSFRSPASGEVVLVSTPLPEDLKHVMNGLQLHEQQ